MSEFPDNAPAPRLCIITKWADFDGYGFNLHAEKSKPGQYIGKVDAGSPAEMAGLLEGDRIVEVNGVNIANENHKQVVQRIKAVSNETRLLVLSPDADKYYKNKNIVVRGTQSNVITKSSERSPPTPEPPATNGHHHHDDGDTRSVSSAASSSAASEASTQPQSPMSTSPTPPPSLDNNKATPTPTPTPTPDPTPAPVKASPTTTTSTTPPAAKPAPSVASNNAFNSSGLNLNMSAAEMRAMLARKKKADPRNDTLDLRKKYEIIQNM